MDFIIIKCYQYLLGAFKGQFSNKMTLVLEQLLQSTFTITTAIGFFMISVTAVAQPSNLGDFQVFQINNELERTKIEVNSASTKFNQHPNSDSLYALAIALEQHAKVEEARAYHIFPYSEGYQDLLRLAANNGDDKLIKKIERLENTAAPDSEEVLWKFRNHALQNYLTARSMYQRLIQAEPNNIKFQRALAVNYTKTDPGHVSIEKIRAYYQPALTILLQLVKSNPNNIELQRDLANVYEIIASKLDSMSGSLPTEYHDALAIRTKIYEQNDKNPLFIQEIAATFSKIANSLLYTKKRAAHDAITDAIGFYQDLVNIDPTNIEWQSALAKSHIVFGDIKRDIINRPEKRNSDEEILAHYNIALTIHLHLIEMKPQDAQLQMDLVNNYSTIGQFYWDHGLRDKVLATYINAQKKMAELAQRFPSDRGWLFYQLHFYFNMGFEYSEIKDRSELSSYEFKSAQEFQEEIFEKMVEIVNKLIVISNA